MSPEPPRASPQPDAPPGPAEGGASRRIAHGTLIRAAGELTAKLASVVFFVVLARELGDTGFGDFIFGVSLSTVVLSVAGFGTDELLAREVARDRSQADGLYANILALKSNLVCFLLVVIAAIVFLGD